jgi:hypothetical protein
MEKTDITEKEAQRIEKERLRRGKEKKALFKKMVKDIQVANRTQVKQAFKREKHKESSRRKRINEYQSWVKAQHESRHKDYQVRQAEIGRRDKVRLRMLVGKRKLLAEQPTAAGEFALSLAVLSGIFAFFAVIVVSFFFGANLSTVLFMGVMAVVLFGIGGYFLAGVIERLSPGFHLGLGAELVAPARGGMVDAVVGDPAEEAQTVEPVAEQEQSPVSAQGN